VLDEPGGQVRARRQIATTEVSLDAPVDRQDREASTSASASPARRHDDIEEAPTSALMREFIERVFQALPDAA
jgi:RNA polymerase primary sigma factor